ncbi:MAG: 50S ribosomal protein L30 [Candidatus Aminicenantes bacterium RBG_13_62_12]|nr:MAG: 50S ribosomal protein L30 [Candidatus Aminicenantes bacterium RBG_13_62_12]
MAVKAKSSTSGTETDRRLKITLVRSTIHRPAGQREVVRGLGLRKLNSQVLRPDRPEIRGMIRKVCHLVKVETVESK